MSKSCSIVNLFAAIRAMAWPTFKGISLAVLSFFSFVGIAALLTLAANPNQSVFVSVESRYFATAGISSLAGFLLYGLYLDWKPTLIFIGSAVAVLGCLLIGPVLYVQWLASVVPDFALNNLSALFAVSGKTMPVRLELIPAQFVVGLTLLAMASSVVWLLWGVLALTCEYGASVRDRERREAA